MSQSRVDLSITQKWIYKLESVKATFMEYGSLMHGSCFWLIISYMKSIIMILYIGRMFKKTSEIYCLKSLEISWNNKYPDDILSNYTPWVTSLFQEVFLVYTHINTI